MPNICMTRRIKVSTETIATVSQMRNRDTGLLLKTPIIRLSEAMIAIKTSSTGKIRPFTN